MVKDLIAKRARIWGEMQALYTRSQEEALSAEDAEQYDRLEAELDELSEQIKRAERHQQRAEEFATVNVETRVLPSGDRVVTRSVRPEATPEYKDAFLRYMRFGIGELSAEDRSILRNGYAVDADDAEGRAASPQSVTTSGGGYLIPAEFQAELIRAMKAYGAIRANARVFETDSGAQISIPTVDDTSNKGRLISINTQVTTSDVSFGQILLDAYKYSSDQVLVPIELMEDAAFDMDGLVTSILAERLGRITEEHYTTGDGSGKPKGIVNASTQGKQGTTGQTTSIIVDDLVDLYHSLDPAYRAGASWMMNDATVKAIRKLKTGVSGDNTFIWQPGLIAGAPDVILGHPVIVSQEMPTMAASAKAILFGNLNRFWIRDVRGIRVVRMNERYAEYDQVGFVSFLRTDSELVAPSSAIKHFANAAS